jgi:hypothetical protein
MKSQIKNFINVKSGILLAAFLLMSFFLLAPSSVVQKDKVEVLKFKIIK